jgi:hypothetical protein
MPRELRDGEEPNKRRGAVRDGGERVQSLAAQGKRSGAPTGRRHADPDEGALAPVKQRRACLGYRARQLSAGALGIGPFELNGIAAKLFGFPGADVANLTVGVVIPALSGDGVGDSFTEFVRGSGGKGVEDLQPAEAPVAAGVGHDGVEDVSGGSGFVIATEILARSGGALFHRGAWREVEEVKGVGIGGGEGAGGDFGLEEFLNCGIGDGLARLGRSQGCGADALAMSDGLPGDAVFGELVDEGTGEDKIEEGVDLAGERGVGRILPRCTPEDREDLDAGEQGAVAIGESRGGSGDVANVGVEGNDTEGVLDFGFRGSASMGFLLDGTSGHTGLLTGLI